MSYLSRNVWKTTAMAGAVSLALLTGCGGGGEAAPAADGGDGGEGGLTVDALRVATTSPTQPGWVSTKYGVETYGPDLGLNMSVDDFTTFDSHSVATQTALGGKADIVAGSFVSHLLLIDQGQDFKVFCPYIGQDDFVIAGANGVNSIEQLFDPGVRVAMDSPGGAGSVIFDAMLQAMGEERTTADMPGQQILESSSLRTSAFAAGEVDATIVHEPQFQDAAPQVDDPVIIASLYEEVPQYIKEAQAAPTAWLDANLESAAAYCASVLLGMEELTGDYDAFAAAVETYSEIDPMPEDLLRETHALISEYPFWPYEDGGLDPETVEFMGEVAVKSGLLDEAPAYEDVVHTGVLERALEIAATHS
jgi:ABC-type nitrate/sulfonate/bicarbonate transport system substrate-binding protein